MTNHARLKRGPGTTSRRTRLTRTGSDARCGATTPNMRMRTRGWPGSPRALRRKPHEGLRDVRFGGQLALLWLWGLRMLRVAPGQAGDRERGPVLRRDVRRLVGETESAMTDVRFARCDGDD